MPLSATSIVSPVSAIWVPNQPSAIGGSDTTTLVCPAVRPVAGIRLAIHGHLASRSGLESGAEAGPSVTAPHGSPLTDEKQVTAVPNSSAIESWT
jgi:hypothetical protein